VSTPEDILRNVTLPAIDAANAPILASAAADVQAAINARDGSGASWQLTLNCQQLTLSYLGQTTNTLTLPLTPLDIESPLETLSTTGEGNVLVTANQDGSYQITLAGSLANTPESASNLTGTVVGAGSLTINQTNPGNAPAGVDRNAAVSAAAAAYTSAVTQDATFRSTVQSDLTSASTDIAAANNPTSSSTQINAIGSVGGDTITWPGITSQPSSADVSSIELNGAMQGLATQITTALADLASQINTVIGEIKTAAGAIDTQVANNAVSHLKDAATQLKNVGQTFLNQIPAVVDTEAQKSAKLAIIQGMVP
jgi:hypothetical protein